MAEAQKKRVGPSLRRGLSTIDKLLTRVYTLADKCHNIVDTMKCQEIEDSF
jgi:hypothetical protein